MPTFVRQAYEILDPQTRRRLPLLFCSFGLVAAFDALSIGLVFPLMLALVDPQAMQRLDWMREIALFLGATEQEQLVKSLGMAIGGLFVVKNLIAALFTRWQFVLISRAEADAGVRLLQRYVCCPWQAVSHRNSSELIRNASTSLSHAFLSVIVPGITSCVEGLLAVGVLIVLMAVDPLVASISFMLVLLVSCTYYAAVRHRLAWIGVKYQEALFGLLNHLKQGILAGREIRVLGRQGEFVAQLARAREVYAQAQAKRSFLNQLPRYYLETVLVLVVLVAAGVALATRTTQEVAPIIAVFGVAALRLMASVSRILASVQQMRIGIEPLKIVHTDLCSPLPEAAALPARSADTKSTGDGSGLVLDRVSFAYRDDRPAVVDLSLTIRWGDSIGVVGPSGSGKSTLIDLILGLLTPQSGRISIDSQDQQAVMAAWRARIGYVPQHIYLTDDSLRRNVAFGLNDAEIDESRVLRAIRLAHLEETVAALPQGLDTIVGEHGATLSGGQRQRVGIARALYHEPDVLILDEATSALDNETENTVVEAVDALRGSKTVIVVAHRLTTVRRCDRILIMNDGRMGAVGTFEELARDNADFARLVDLSQLPERHQASGGST